MSDAATKPPRMTVEEFLVWAEGRPGRYELADGEVIKMQEEREAHNLVKFSIAVAFRQALAGKQTGCQTFTDGMAVRIDADMAFEPDAMIDCGPRNPDARLAPKPVVVVEVVSPSTSRIDEGRKFLGYFSLPSIHHYLIVDARRRLVIHHRRNGEEIATRFLHANAGGGGTLLLDPPGISVEIADFFAELDAA